MSFLAQIVHLRVPYFLQYRTQLTHRDATITIKIECFEQSVVEFVAFAQIGVRESAKLFLRGAIRCRGQVRERARHTRVFLQATLIRIVRRSARFSGEMHGCRSDLHLDIHAAFVRFARRQRFAVVAKRDLESAVQGRVSVRLGITDVVLGSSAYGWK